MFRHNLYLHSATLPALGPFRFYRRRVITSF